MFITCFRGIRFALALLQHGLRTFGGLDKYSSTSKNHKSMDIDMGYKQMHQTTSGYL